MSSSQKSAAALEQALSTKPVHFVHNGHAWEAFEILGLSPGADLESVEAAYQKLKSEMDPSSQELVDFAYQALLSCQK